MSIVPIRLASTDWTAPDDDRIRFLAIFADGVMGRSPAPAELKCLFSVPSRLELPKYIPYGILTAQEGGFLRKRTTYRHALNHQMMPDVWTDKKKCEHSLHSAVNVVGDALYKGHGEAYDLIMQDGPQHYSVSKDGVSFIVTCYDMPAETGAEVVRAVISDTVPFIPFDPVPVTIYGYKHGAGHRWEIRIPGWLETFAVMDDQRKAQEAVDGMIYQIGLAVLLTVMAKLGPQLPNAVQMARHQVGIVNNFGRLLSGLEPQQIE